MTPQMRWSLFAVAVSVLVLGWFGLGKPGFARSVPYVRCQGINRDKKQCRNEQWSRLRNGYCRVHQWQVKR